MEADHENKRIEDRAAGRQADEVNAIGLIEIAKALNRVAEAIHRIANPTHKGE